MAAGTAADPAADLARDLFERYHQQIYAYLWRMVRDQQLAEDLAQQTFLNALNARRQLPRVRNHRAWLYRIATNLALNALKRGRRFAWLPWQAADRRAVVADGTLDRLGGPSAVEAALAALPAALRAPLLLHAHHGLSVCEIAGVLKLSEGAVRMRLCRARRAFRQAYEKESAP